MPTAPEIAPTAACANAPLEPPALRWASKAKPGQLDPERGGLGVDAVGAAGAQRVDVLAGLGRERLHQPARVGQDELADALDLQRQPGVEHVARGQAVVDPAPGGPGRRGQHVDEGGGVVVGDLLALVDRLDGEGGARGSRRAPRRSGRPSPRRRPPRPRASPQSARGRTRPRRARGVCSARSRAPKATPRRSSISRARVTAATTLFRGPGRHHRAPSSYLAALQDASRRPGKRASRSSRRRRFSRVVPCGRCWITPASRRTLK